MAQSHQAVVGAVLDQGKALYAFPLVPIVGSVGVSWERVGRLQSRDGGCSKAAPRPCTYLARGPCAVKVTRALVSVSDKSGVVSFAQALETHGVEILSTGGRGLVVCAAGAT